MSKLFILFIIFYGQNSYADNLLGSVKKMSRIFQTTETLKTYEVDPKKKIMQKELPIITALIILFGGRNLLCIKSIANAGATNKTGK